MEWYPHTQQFLSVEDAAERQELKLLGKLTKRPCNFYEGEPGYTEFMVYVEKGWATYEQDKERCRRFVITDAGREYYRAALLRDLAIQGEGIARMLESHHELVRQVRSGELF